MRKVFIVVAILAMTGCATEAKPPFEVDGQGYYRLPIGNDPAALAPEMIGEQMARGEMYCRERGQTAETGFVVGPKGSFVRFRCVDEPPAQK